VVKNRYTARGIHEEGKFSINIPSNDLVVELDYHSITSGAEKDKSELFTVFYGELRYVPMIHECPVCVELAVYDVLEMVERLLFVGEVKHVYTEEKYLTDGKLDQEKIRQMAHTQPPSEYWLLGENVADAFSVGKKIRSKTNDV
jgi:flavin reductase (DIM6/NTAB) family NADH-FMN oxidoreductase RutF